MNEWLKELMMPTTVTAPILRHPGQSGAVQYVQRREAGKALQALASTFFTFQPASVGMMNSLRGQRNWMDLSGLYPGQLRFRCDRQT